MSLKHPAANISSHRRGSESRIHGARSAKSGQSALLHRVASAVELGALAVYTAETHLAKSA